MRNIKNLLVIMLLLSCVSLAGSPNKAFIYDLETARQHLAIVRELCLSPDVAEKNIEVISEELLQAANILYRVDSELRDSRLASQIDVIEKSRHLAVIEKKFGEASAILDRSVKVLEDFR